MNKLKHYLTKVLNFAMCSSFCRRNYDQNILKVLQFDCSFLGMGMLKKPRLGLWMCMVLLLLKRILLMLHTVEAVKTKKILIIPPNVGLEPTTLRLRVSCSTD